MASYIRGATVSARSHGEAKHRREKATQGEVRMTRVATTWLGVLVLIAFIGCATTLAPGAEKIRVTRNPADVEGCKAVGTVEARAPYNTANDAKHQMQNGALPLGADVVFITNYSDKATGVAYQCQGRPR